jgi:hypothetical protein
MVMRVALLAAAVAALACDAQVDGRFDGVPLATLRGEITSRRAQPLAGDARMAVVWDTNGAVLAQPTELEVHGQFPSSFTVDILEPPPDDALNDVEVDGRVYHEAIGIIAVTDGQTIDTPYGLLLFPNLWEHMVGADAEHMVIYAAEDIPARGHFPAMTKGYHLVRRGQPKDTDEVRTCFGFIKETFGIVTPGMTVYCERNYLESLEEVDGGFDHPITVDLADPIGSPPYSPIQWG